MVRRLMDGEPALAHPLTSCAQGHLHHLDDIHVDYCSSHGRNLFCSSSERLDLRLERGKRRAQVWPFLRVHCRLVVVHGLDDLRRQLLPRMSCLLSLPLK